MSEHDHQVALFDWAAIHKQKELFKRRLLSIPNQGGSGINGKLRGFKMVEEGLKAGTSDIFFAHPMSGAFGLVAHGMWIELKDLEKYLLRIQKAFILDMRNAGYMAFGVRGSIQAGDLIDLYLRDPDVLVDLQNEGNFYYGDSGKRNVQAQKKGGKS